MNNCCICWVFSSTFFLGILIFKRLTARHLYKSFGVKGLIDGYTVRLESRCALIKNTFLN
jgi:hypothetical protein